MNKEAQIATEAPEIPLLFKKDILPAFQFGNVVFKAMHLYVQTVVRTLIDHFC